ncbi:hypothetical protein [Neolewinella persica]|uniref:hypothetical protein n=1 Tax=Neolewinella persica TaxID=70998 RepID=UPI000362B02B|nr:hypothetical protein [Neolewinella persica]
MKRRLTTFFSLLVFLLAIIWTMGQSRWHLNRNDYNEKPTGTLVVVKDSLYQDTKGREWIRLPHHMNAFHQPANPIPAPAKPYGTALDTLNFTYEPDNPNLKLLSKTEDGGSMEAILQPDGTYLEEGPLLGTYNYGHPEGFRGIVEHTLWDVIPHFANANYRVPAAKSQ